jgi:hypothetical protein
VRVDLSAQTPSTLQARLRIEQPAKIAAVGNYRPRQSLKQERNAYLIPLKRSVTSIDLIETK